MQNFKIESVNISKQKGTVKIPVGSIEVTLNGITNDAHAGNWHRQVSVMMVDSLENFNKRTGQVIKAGDFAENILITGLDLNTVSVLDRFQIGEVELEVTQIGKKCHGGGCAIFQAVGECAMPKEGIFTRVIKTGTIKAGDVGTYLPHSLKVAVITLSDRASKGEYADLSGPAVTDAVKSFFDGKRWHLEVTNILMPDNQDEFTALLKKLAAKKTDIIISTGSTGIGTRDIAFEAVSALNPKYLPGIMDHIRLKYATNNSSALTSRSVAAVLDKSLIFTLPGSVKAVKEYTAEILPLTEHLITMLHDIGH